MAFKWPKSQQTHAYTPLQESPDSERNLKKLPGRNIVLQLVRYVITFAAGVVVASSFLLVNLVSPSTSPNANSVEINDLNTANVDIELTKSPVPPIPLTTIAFQENKTFIARPSPETDRAWNHLLPPGRGFVFIDNSSQYDLPPGQETQWGEIYSVAMFHELHCLAQLRKAYWTLIKGVETGDVRKSKLLLGKHGEHVCHCFDYLRQGIMCAGDLSMEWPRTEADGRRIAVDGWGAKHTCKSWNAIQQYMEDNHFDHSMKLDIAT